MSASVEPLEERQLLSPMGAQPLRGRPHAEIHAPAHPRRSPDSQEQAADGLALRNVRFGGADGRSATLDVFGPGGKAPSGGWPVIVAIHGGGWRKYNNKEYEPVVAPLVKLGFVVVAPNYPLSRPGSRSWPTNLEVVRDAVRWVRANAATLDADPGRIAAMGESAGGHLAAMLGTDLEAANPVGGVSSRVQAVVDFYGPTDLASLYEHSPAARPAVRQLLGTTPQADPALYADASPVSHVSAGDAPTLIVQGTADDLVLPSQSAELATALTAAGVPNRLVYIPGAEHGFGLSAGGRDLSRDVARFLNQAMPGT